MRQGTTSAVSTVFLASVALSAFACSSEPSAGGVILDDAGDSGLFEDASADVPSEPEPEPFTFVETSDPEDFASSCYDAPADAPAGHDFCPGAFCGECTYERPELHVFARASDLGEGVKFVAMHDELVLAESADKQPLLYRLDHHKDDPPVRLAVIPFDPAPASDMRGRAIAGMAFDGYAVLCNEASCVVYQTESRDEKWVARRLSVSLPVDAKGVVGAFTWWDEEESERMFCIFGDGIHCQRGDGAFSTLATGEGGKLLAMDQHGHWLVGENGRIVRFDAKKVAEPYRGIDARLHAVASNHGGESAWAAGEGGIVLAFGKAGPRACRSNHEILAASASSWHGFSAWVETDGTFIEAPIAARKRWCSSSMAPMDGLFAVRIRPCGVVQNRWMLSAEEIRGEMHCMYD